MALRADQTVAQALEVIAQAGRSRYPVFREGPDDVVGIVLAKDVWREPHRATPLDNVIDVHVAHLRRKVDDGERVKLLHTIRGVGFVLRAEESK